MICKTKNAPDLSSEGAEINGFYDNSTLKLISVNVFGSSGSCESDYYMVDEKTVFLVEKNYVYSGSIADDTFKVDKEYVALYILSDENVYEFDFSEMKMGDKLADSSRKDILNKAISSLNE